MRERSPASGVSIGGLTVLVIFTVLCLTIFSVISLSSAQTDLRLSDRNIEQTVRYYEADGKAEEQLRAVDLALKKAGAESTDETGFWQRAEIILSGLNTDEIKGIYDQAAQSYSYTLPISDVLSLQVELKLAYRGGSPETRVLSWKAYSTLDYTIDEEITLWDGLS